MARSTTSYRRHLPHLRREGATYMVTWTLARRDRSLVDAEREVVLNAIRFFDGQRCKIIATVVMDDHVHVLVTPGMQYPLSKLVHSWKSFSAHELVKSGRKPPVWADEYLDTIIRAGPHLHRAIEYIRGNPGRRWPEIHDYRWLYVAE